MKEVLLALGTLLIMGAVVTYSLVWMKKMEDRINGKH